MMDAVHLVAEWARPLFVEPGHKTPASRSRRDGQRTLLPSGRTS